MNSSRITYDVFFARKNGTFPNSNELLNVQFNLDFNAKK